MARILVVDDDAEIRAVIRLALEQAGHEVTEAADGSEGLKLFLLHRTDLVITDVFMPERDGVEFMHLIRLMVGTAPILVISGGGVWPQEMVSLLDTTMRLGATRTLRKPFRPAELVLIVEDMLRVR